MEIFSDFYKILVICNICLYSALTYYQKLLLMILENLKYLFLKIFSHRQQ